MKGSLGTSLVLHTLVLGAALVSLSAPASFDVADVEALPVDIIPVESITQMQQGDKTAPLSQTPTPKPTNNQTVVENAENAGENDVDLKTPPTPAKKPLQTEAAAAPKPTERPTPTPTPEQNEVKDIVPEETAPKPTEMASLPEPKPEPTPPRPEPTPAPTAEPAPAETAAEELPLPDSIPLPAAKPRPEPPKEEAKPVEKPAEKKPETPKPTETAKADTKAKEAAKPSNKKEGKKQETAKSSSSKASDFNADEIAALLNKQEASGGGAKRSSSPASTGSTKPSTGAKLSQSEMDALRGQIQNNWSYIAGIEGADGVVIRVSMQLDQSGAIVGEPEVSSSGGSDTARRTLESSARRAVLKSSPFRNLPSDKYDAWSEVVVNFSPSDLL